MHRTVNATILLLRTKSNTKHDFFLIVIVITENNTWTVRKLIHDRPNPVPKKI